MNLQFLLHARHLPLLHVRCRVQNAVLVDPVLHQAPVLAVPFEDLDAAVDELVLLLGV